VQAEFVGALDLENLTGTKASTWRYWAMIGEGPKPESTDGLGV
jgi:prophage regulatory protein